MVKPIASRESPRKVVPRSIARQSHDWKDVVEGVRSLFITEPCILILDEF